ncbi:unnamed protein product [Toxocara canis]|uniref:TMF_TATA_bd domain-containing protein n=1 Tax=Toxocara canis TaxID=6265 RepID=A0A183UWH4_TOXCA|nr:unnamed protein product [Toxocara canis]
MDEVDDGLGSELNTPRDSHQSTQADVSLDTSVEPSSVPTTSTPKNANRQCGVSSSPFGLDLSAVQEATVEDTSSSVKRQDESGDYSALGLDWAANLASKQMELLQLTDEHGRTRQQLQSIQEVISQLQSRVSSAEDTIDDLNSERMALLAKLEQYKKSSENKEMALTKYKEELLLAHEKLKQLENISVEVEVEKEADHEVIAKLMSENEESKALISQLKQEAQQREEVSLSRRPAKKEALLLAANEERYQLADWRDRATRLEQLANSQSAQMKRYEVMEQRFSDTVKHLADQRAKVSELSGELKVQTDNAKMYHDEVLHLRAKLDEMKLASACAANDSSTSKELVRLRDECERLQNQLEAGREIKRVCDIKICDDIAVGMLPGAARSRST